MRMPAATQSGSSFVAAVRQRCPRCRQGPIFGGLIRTNEYCPQCGLRFEREQGYFLGAMYFSYALATGVLLPFWVRWRRVMAAGAVVVTLAVYVLAGRSIAEHRKAIGRRTVLVDVPAHGELLVLAWVSVLGEREKRLLRHRALEA